MNVEHMLMLGVQQPRAPNRGRQEKDRQLISIETFTSFFVKSFEVDILSKGISISLLAYFVGNQLKLELFPSETGISTGRTLP